MRLFKAISVLFLVLLNYELCLSATIDYNLNILEKALKNGNGNAAILLSRFYRYDSVRKNVNAAISILERGIASECIKCWRELALIYDDASSSAHNEAKASEAFLKGAQAGDAESMREVGRRMVEKIGFSANKATEGLQWLERAAAAGNLTAIGEMGIALINVSGDLERAAQLLERALSFAHDPHTQFEIYLPYYLRFASALAKLHEDGKISNSSSIEYYKINAAYFPRRGRVLSVNIFIDCFEGKRPFSVFAVDWDRDLNPVEHQAIWLEKQEGCVIPRVTKEALSNLYDIARQNDVLYTDILQYSFGPLSKTHQLNSRSR